MAYTFLAPSFIANIDNIPVYSDDDDNIFYYVTKEEILSLPKYNIHGYTHP